MITNVGDVSHATESHVRAPGHQAGGNGAIVHGLLGVAPQNMIKCFHEGAVLIDEMQNATDVHLFETVKKRMVDGLTALGILKGPAHL